MDSSFVVRYKNEVARSTRRLSLIERRIITCAISLVPQDHEVTDQELYYVRASDLTWLGSDPKYVYSQMKEAADHLYERSIVLTEKDATKLKMVRKFRMVQEAEYRPEEASIALRFGHSFIPFLTALRSEFTYYQVQDTIGFRSTYTQPVYSYLMQYMHAKDKGLEVKARATCRLEIDAFRELLGIEDGVFASFGDLRIYVLEVVVRQINESSYTRIKVSYDLEKKGRRYWRILFKMTRKPGVVSAPPTTANEDVIDVEAVEVKSGNTDPKPATASPSSWITCDKLPPEAFELSEKQIVVLADWLAGRNKAVVTKHGYNVMAFIRDMETRRFAPRMAFVGDDGDLKLRDWLKKRLQEPNFVRAIGTWIDTLRFRLSSKAQKGG